MHSDPFTERSNAFPRDRVPPEEQFFKNRAYLERGMPYFAFVDTNAVLVRKIEKLLDKHKKLPFVRGS